MIISLAGLWMVDNQALRSMALGAMTVVAVSILTATTLLPVADRDCSATGSMPGGIVGRASSPFFRQPVLPHAARERRARRAAPAFWERWTAA